MIIGGAVLLYSALMLVFTKTNMIKNIILLLLSLFVLAIGILIVIKHGGRRGKLLKKLEIYSEDDMYVFKSKAVSLTGKDDAQFLAYNGMIVNMKTNVSYSISDIQHIEKTMKTFDGEPRVMYYIVLTVSDDPYSDKMIFERQSERDEVFRMIMEAYEPYGNPGDLL